MTNSDENQTYALYQYPANANEDVMTYGGSIGISYYFNKHYSANMNFTYSEIDTSNLNDPIIPGFNTPKHKLNFGVDGKKIYKGLGFSLNYKWVQGFKWESSFGDGDVPSYALFDTQLRYEFKNINSIFRIGVSNLLKNMHIEAYGSPRVGRMAYFSWTYKVN